MQWTTQPAWGQECCVSVHTEFSAYMQQVQKLCVLECYAWTQVIREDRDIVSK